MVLLCRGAFQPVIAVHWCLGSFLPRGKWIYFPLLNFIRLLSAQLLTLSRSPVVAPTLLATPSGFASLQISWPSPFPSSKSVTKSLNCSGSVSPWGIHYWLASKLCVSEACLKQILSQALVSSKSSLWSKLKSVAEKHHGMCLNCVLLFQTSTSFTSLFMWLNIRILNVISFLSYSSLFD